MFNFKVGVIHLGGNFEKYLYFYTNDGKIKELYMKK